MSEQYDLKKSEEGIGQLYPILEAKDGEIIDGFHREEANAKWKRLRLRHIDTEEKKLVARLVANFHRRQVLREEKEEWINGLARIYQKQGLKVSSKAHRNEIMAKIMEVTGLSDRAVGIYLDGRYKQKPPYDVEKRQPVIPASERIEHRLGKEYVERHREEVKQELLKSPTFQREVIREIQKPQVFTPAEPCPSGVCELPPRIESGEPVDIMAESLVKFWENNPQCQCKTCEHYEKCGVIR